MTSRNITTFSKSINSAFRERNETFEFSSEYINVDFLIVVCTSLRQSETRTQRKCVFPDTPCADLTKI